MVIRIIPAAISLIRGIYIIHLHAHNCLSAVHRTDKDCICMSILDNLNINTLFLNCAFTVYAFYADVAKFFLSGLIFQKLYWSPLSSTPRLNLILIKMFGSRAVLPT